MSAQPVDEDDLLRRLLRNEATIAEVRASLTPEDAATFDAELRTAVPDPGADVGDAHDLVGSWARVALLTLQLGHEGHRRMLMDVEDRLRHAATGERKPAWDWRSALGSHGVDG